MAKISMGILAVGAVRLSILSREVLRQWLLRSARLRGAKAVPPAGEVVRTNLQYEQLPSDSAMKLWARKLRKRNRNQ
jgi:hypothetical protein